MATLRDTINRNSKALRRGPGGLTEETTEEIQSLAGKAGIAPPVTPLGAAMLGANPDQQKMMGDKRQKEAALNIATQGTQNLNDVRRTLQSRTQATSAEQASQQKSQALQNLGPLGERVNQYIENQRTALGAAAHEAAANVAPVEVQAANNIQLPQGQDLTNFKELLKQYRSQPNNMELLLQINKALGRNVNSVLAPAEVDSLYENSVDAIARGGAGVVDDALTAEDLAAQPQFGYNLQQLSDLLGVPTETARNMTVSGIRNRINELAQSEFSNVSGLQQAATGQALGAAERGLARSQLREASSIGTRSTEADVANLQQQIANADQVTFGGKQYSVDQLLKDDTISGIISNYLSLPDGSPEKTQLEQSEPQLWDFIKRNKSLLENASRNMQAGAQEFGDIQQANQQVGTVAGTSFSPDVMKEVLPNQGELSATRVDPNSISIVAAARSLPNDQAAKLVNNTNALIKQNPALASQLQSLTPEEAKGLARDDVLDKAVQNQKESQHLAEIKPDDVDSIISTYFGENTDRGSVEKALSEVPARRALGFDARSNSELDRNGDGKLDDLGGLLSKMQSEVPAASLKDIVTGNVAKFQPRDRNGLLDQPHLNAIQQMALDKLGPYAADGDVNWTDINKANFSEQELWDLKDSGITGKWGSDATSQLDRNLNNFIVSRTSGILNSTFTGPGSDVASKVIAYRNAPSSYQSYVNKLTNLPKPKYYLLTFNPNEGGYSKAYSDYYDANYKASKQLRLESQYAIQKANELQSKLDTMKGNGTLRTIDSKNVERQIANLRGSADTANKKLDQMDKTLTAYSKIARIRGPAYARNDQEMNDWIDAMLYIGEDPWKASGMTPGWRPGK